MKKIFYGFFIILIVSLTACADASQSSEASSTEESISPSIKNDQSTLLRFPVNDDGTIDSNNLAILTFEEEEYDYGTITEGDIVHHTFTFTNTGRAPLIISHARSTCGCTVPDWPQQPVAPGETGNIVVKFNSANRPGKQRKPITIISNTIPNEHEIYISGLVKEKE